MSFNAERQAGNLWLPNF